MDDEPGGGSERRDLSILRVGSLAAARRAAREREPGDLEGRDDAVRNKSFVRVGFGWVGLNCVFWRGKGGGGGTLSGFLLEFWGFGHNFFWGDFFSNTFSLLFVEFLNWSMTRLKLSIRIDVIE